MISPRAATLPELAEEAGSGYGAWSTGVSMRIAVLFALLSSTALADGDATKGQALYTSNCMACHGTEGDGNGPAARALRPPPKPFNTADFWKDMTDDRLKTAIRAGQPGTAMMAFGQLTDQDVMDVIAFLKTKRPPGQ